ncbi:hypothetical protein [Sagittula stellata]|uniref:2-octaprenyl-6-methoxyphenyl hydroxylase n=1 Tax=Sagittula stellata (strain ATCC 700073 / DSM 11524 / E-37) TaxID=388399 RepID=A3JZG5_SAGS3|nr:hypothetical protein [Sagittula stellata]EBA09868.1 2-octaprenyl-6-methoxyphenyl hydroxylase [Sagittula stellata E-37]
MTTEDATLSHETAKTPASVVTLILMCVVLFVALTALATWTWGLPALAMIALALVPVMYALLILISMGR